MLELQKVGKTPHPMKMVQFFRFIGKTFEFDEIGQRVEGSDDAVAVLAAPYPLHAGRLACATKHVYAVCRCNIMLFLISNWNSFDVLQE